MKQTKYLILSLLIFIISGTIEAQNQTPIIVVIDAGHGGKDPGNLRGTKNSLDEKDINLKIAKKTGNYIDSLLSNVKIIYTRTKDVYLSPEERADIANEKKADYFISIHCNSNPDKKIHGAEFHVHTQRCKKSVVFANKLHYQFSKRARIHSRGVKNFEDRKKSNILVVRDTEMPAVLIECGFMSNKKEEKYLNSEYGQTIIASAIYRALKDYTKAKKKPQCENIYRVQIKASVKKIPFNSIEFKNIKYKITEIKGNKKATFRYKYFIGEFCSFKEANNFKNKVRKEGIKDAFVVKTK